MSIRALRPTGSELRPYNEVRREYENIPILMRVFTVIHHSVLIKNFEKTSQCITISVCRKPVF